MTRDEILQLRDLIDRSLRSGISAVVATLVAREGHSYREPGSMMVMNEALEVAGGVSGGCLEEYIGRAGRELLRDRDSALMNFDTSDDGDTDRPVLGCGGRLQILVEMARPDHLDYLDVLLATMQRSDRAATMFNLTEQSAYLSPSQCRSIVVDDAVVFGDALLDSQATELVGEAISLRESLTVRNRSGFYAANYLWPQPRLVVFGAREDAMPLMQIAKAASWYVTVVDRRLRLATTGRFPLADQVIAERWDAAIGSIEWNRWTAAVAMTHSLGDDAAILGDLLARDIAYLGLLGPSVRADKLWAALPADGRSRVRSPVGLALGDKSPAAVAVAIMAELIAWRRGRVIVDAPRPRERVP